MSWKRFLIPIGIVGTAFLLLGTVVLLSRGESQKSVDSEVWTCSMHPQIRLPTPGPCPICGMKLIPISQLPNAQDDLEKRAGLETEVIRYRELFKEIRTVGKLEYNERQMELIAARVPGRVDRVFADFTGMEVKKGDHLVAIYSPELYAAQNELLIQSEAHEREKQALSNARAFTESRLESSRTKLRLLGILDEQIEEIETTKKISTLLTIYAPLGGTVVEKNIRVGQYVNAGDPMYRIAGLDPIWLYLNIYEYDIAWVRFGQPVEVALEAFVGETFRGTVTFIDPFLDDATRTIRVRVNLKNADRRLKPQMYATATIRVPLRADGSSEPTGLEGKYICPMHPEVVEVAPGKCSICEMPLERVPDLAPSPTRAAVGLSQPDGTAERTDHAAHKEKSKEPADDKDSSDGKADDKMREQVADKSPGKADKDAELAIPVSAVLDTGRRRITYRLTKDGGYELVELKLGTRAQAVEEAGRRRDYYLVLDGLNGGDKVVVQSGFLLDSQRQIEGMPSLLFPTGQSGVMSGHAGHGGASANSDSGRPTSPPPAVTMPAGHKH